MHERIFDLLVHETDISWKSIIYDLIRSQEIDPWDINITILSKKYIERLHELKKLDLKVSGKVILAAALLLKIKSKRLLGDDLLEFDRLLAGPPQDDDSFYDDLAQEAGNTPQSITENESFPIYPRTPQPRKRKVSVFDLLSALEKALEVKARRQNRLDGTHMSAPEKGIDIDDLLDKLLDQITDAILHDKDVTFASLLGQPSREEKVKIFIPLLYLSTEQKINLHQQEPFGEIRITLPKENPSLAN